MIERVQKNGKFGFTDIAQAAFFALAVLLATGCASTGGGVRTGLIAPITTAHQGSVQEGNGFLPTTTESGLQRPNRELNAFSMMWQFFPGS
jgi:hypothetical protein